MSGEPAPRHIIKSGVEMKPYGAVSFDMTLLMYRYVQ